MDFEQRAVTTLHRTPLYQQHLALGARMVPFAGWEMPLQYIGIIAEHHAVRQRVGLFDISHMGRLVVAGSDAAAFLRRLVTRNVAKLEVGRAQYALLCDEEGSILDDIMVYRTGPENFLVVTNAANADKDRQWIVNHRQPDDEVSIYDKQMETAMLALQGPRAVEQLAASLPGVVATLGRRCCTETVLDGAAVLVARTGYTGEDGFELVLPAAAGVALWQRLVKAGVQPCGLGARDSLRLEAALPLYGQDINTSTNPFEAGLDWVLDLKDADFIGKRVLLAIREEGTERRLVCLRAQERAILRAACPILYNGQQVGHITSGGYSPTLETSIAMGYVPVKLAQLGTQLQADVRGRMINVLIVPRPFYRKS